MRPLLLAAALAALALGGCAPRHARPAVLDAAAVEAQTPSSQEAAQLAPATYAEAEKLRRDADAAMAAGDPSAAQFLAEQAIATYARAFAQARAVRASRAHDEARGQLDAAQAELDKLKTEQQQVASEVQDLETRIKVAREALPVTSSGPAGDAGRAQARREAARALETEARLLCLSARLLAPEAEGLKDAEAGLQELTKTLDDPKASAPIDPAMRARARCLEALSMARRKADNPASRIGDALLAELSRQGSFSPVREDRGVVVAVHGAFDGEALSKEATEKLEILGRVAAAHPTLPVVLVVHDAERSDAKRGARRAEAAKRLVAKHRAERLETVFAGATRPLIDPKNKKDRARNERLEVVFVDAGG